jgi:hypothetical protein
MSTIKVIVARVEQQPGVEEIDSSLEGMQAIVGGYIECVSLSEGLDLWFNEEGRINGMPFNRLITDDRGNEWDIHGDLFLARHDDEGETIGVTSKDISDWIMQLYDRRPFHF